MDKERQLKSVAVATNKHMLLVIVWLIVFVQGRYVRGRGGISISRMRSFVTLLVYLLLVVPCVLATQKFQKAAKPNFLLFFIDDIGWGDLGANWEPNKDVTPNLNELSRSGIRFTDFHAGASVCGPSRAALLTGRLGLRNGVIRNFNPRSVGGLPLNETTLPEVLKGNGYNTGMIGKWHLGITKHFHPCSRGFNYYYGLPYSNDMGCIDCDAYNHPQCKKCPQQSGVTNDQAIKCPSYDTALPLYENYDIIEQPANLVDLGDRYVEKASSFIQQAKNKTQPFFLYVATAHTHVPLAYAKRFHNSTSHDTRFSDTLHELDDMIGRIMTSLKDNGMYDNTITWFTGDNGPWSVKCQYGGSPGPFLGTWQYNKFGGGSTAKATTWEAGHREPTFVVWPGVIKPNTTSNALTSALDIFPTLLSIAGVGLPPYKEYDGKDISGLLTGEYKDGHKVLFHPNSGSIEPGKVEALRYGPYKLYWSTGGIQPSCHYKFAPLLFHNPPLVFDLSKDPAESIPLTTESYPNLNEVISEATKLREDLLDNIKKDNTSVADYSKSSSVLPCCDPTQYYCRCNHIN